MDLFLRGSQGTMERTKNSNLRPVCSWVSLGLWGFVVLSVCVHRVCSQESAGAGTGFSLQPPYFNLAEGAKIKATATCGEEESAPGPWGGEIPPQPRTDLYCKLVGGPTDSVNPGHSIQGQFCDFCDASDPNKAHPVTYAIDGTERWWQSPPLSLGLKYNEVNITIDLDQLFQVAYVLIKFANSPRPDLWVLERSVDFGRTYSPWQYFANSKIDCLNYFGKETKQPIIRDDDVICTTEYSRIVPLENGEIVVSLVNGRPGAKHFMDSPVLREFTKATNIRLRFLRTNTLLGHLISKAQKDRTVTRRYYYSIKDISIGGRCVCHGHSDVCTLRPGNQNLYQCQCQHNACGEICDRCCPGYNQKPWQPATVDTANECEPCNCHGHATDCYYDADVDNRKASLDIYGRYSGGGVCINCQHNTAGVNCERCLLGFYRPYGVPKEALHGCIPCRCNPDQSNGCEEGSGKCYCKPNYSGNYCERCAVGYYSFPDCIRIPFYPLPTSSPTSEGPAAGDIVGCQCTGVGAMNNDCDMKTGHCYCRTGFQGAACDRCAVGYFLYPFCQKCECHPAGVLPDVCDPVGRCLCRFSAGGARCDRCNPGYHSFPKCEECNCDMFGSTGPACNSQGQCRCRENYGGLTCNECASGFYSFPNCLPCRCSEHGAYYNSCDSVTGQCDCRPGFTGQTCDRCSSRLENYPFCQACRCSEQGAYHSTCDPVTGQCDCRPGFVGQTCDRCSSGLQIYPLCQGFNDECNPAGTMDSQGGQCQCLPRVEGLTCNRCKPLYWNLASENRNGCTDCKCELKGTISGVGECHQTEGDCHCKPNVCSTSCDTCKDGYFSLETRNYFGCQGCQCDVGGAVSHMCSETSGACVCRNNIEGNNCNQPTTNYYLPDLHQLKYEIEDGITPSGRGVRFGYDPLQFPGFSWRGYAEMTSIQNEVRISVNLEKPNLCLFHIILKYVNLGLQSVAGRISVYPSHSPNGSAQVRDIVFPSSTEPAFISLIGKGVDDAFSLTPGNWLINIMAEGVLLDYLVMLPSEYYEASLLHIRVNKPCANTGLAGENCLVYQHLPVERFACAFGTEGKSFKQNGITRPIVVRQPSPGLPLMADLAGRQVEFHLQLNVQCVGFYVLLIEYINEDTQQYVANVIINSKQAPVSEAKVNLYSCKYSFPCRSIAIDNMNRIAVFELQTDVEIQLIASSVSFLLHRVCLVPEEDFSVEYAEPKVHCIAAYSTTSSQRPSCIRSSNYENPPTSLILDAVKDSKDSDVQRNVIHDPVGSPWHQYSGVLLKAPQNHITLNKRLPVPGRYVFFVQYSQLLDPTFPVSVLVNGGDYWTGSFNASFCPHVFGCRELVITRNRITLDIINPDVLVTVTVPPQHSLVLEYILVVPADSYTHEILHEKPLDISLNFINICGGNSFYIDPFSSSEFCTDSAKSLSAFYNNGALPCNCNVEGATSTVCNPFGGQCNCRPNIIGRHCSNCATGYYGFPHCRPCNCGRRLCDEVTGKCICPPQTVRPNCEVCEKQSFSYHPIVGCERCNCSRPGIVRPTQAECDETSGQCKCKSRITGRRCDRCSPGYYRYPDCIPCDCHTDGTEPDICDPDTGACLCKKNVEGLKCDVCRKGSFYLELSNQKGCTTCFCFQVTDNCLSSNKHRKKFVEMRSWGLETLDQARIATTYNPFSNSIVADVQELPLPVQSLYWLAPESYLGNKMASYGGFLTYQLKSFGLPSEGMVLLSKRPEVILTGRQMTIAYMDPINPLPDRLYYGRVKLVEGNFRHANSNSAVSREELMLVLSRLESLHIRALYFSETQRLTLGEVGLEDVTFSGSGRIASSVEICSCPPQYAGDSCQECAPGYYRDNQGSFLGRCVPCRCNGHSSRCQDGSGICINCQQNTAGDNCELCKEGFTGNASLGTCRICPCPLSVPSNSFATGCVGTGRNMKCFCKPGYTGVSCERCAPGFYGNPLKFGSSCQPCSCGNNGQQRSCDSLTGECFDEEPKDDGEDTESCDSCVNILLTDLTTMSNELNLIKSKLQNMGVSNQALEQMRALEGRIREVKSQYDSYNSKLLNQRTKVDRLGVDTDGLKQEITALLEKADLNAKKYEAISMSAEGTFRNASQLLLTIELLTRNINMLVQDISNEGGSPSGDITKNMAEAQRMLNEMRKRNFKTQKTQAELEKAEAQALLNRVRNQFQKHQDQHKDLIKDITKSINDYEAKLNDLRDVLDEASEKTKQANNINKDNAATLENIKKTVKDLSKQQKDASSHLNAAETSLAQTGSMLQLLQKSKEEYEKLAAQLDGAKQELNEKVSQLSKAASKEPLVIMAEEHAANLQRLANQLTEIKRNASSDELVQSAVGAANAYENIINAVNAADEAAKKAKEAADSAFNKVQSEDLPGKAKSSRTESESLLEQAKKTQKSLQDLNPEIEDIKDRLVEAKEKKNGLSGDLKALQNSINDIKRDDIDSMIKNAKDMVNNANTITDNVQNELKPIKDDVDNLKGTIGSTQSADFNEALNDASNSVKNLTNQLPDLFDAINRINELMPLGNISENVNRIRELIQQARDAANKVAVPMRFDGNSGVEVRPPSNLEDLKAYTSFSLLIQRPQSRSDRRKRQLSANMFVMYFGNKDTSKDYIGLAVRDGRLVCVYNLGGNEREIEVEQFLTSSNPEDATMDRVTFERIYQYAKLDYIKSATLRPSSKDYTIEVPRYTLLDLDPDNIVFYVGGYPPEFRPPSGLNYVKYQGCIELEDFNQNVASLYNFKRTFNINTTQVEPCRRRKEESDTIFFEGTGYAKIATTQTPINNLRFEQTIQTTVDNGLLFFVEDGDNYICLSIENGKFVLKYKMNSDSVQEIKSKENRINDNKQHLVMVQFLVRQKWILITDQSIQINATNVQVPDFTTYFLGGIPSSIREKFNIKTPPFRGCVKNVKTPVSSAKFIDTYGVSQRCPDNWQIVRSAEFSQGGILELNSNRFTFPNNFQAAFGFQTPEINGILFKHITQSDDIQISLEEGNVLVKTRNSRLRSQDKYTDGKLHYVSVIRKDDKFSLLVDDKEVSENVGSPLPSGNSAGNIYFGGNDFEGCVSNVFIQRASQSPSVQDLFDNIKKEKVSIGTCTIEDDPLPLILNDYRSAYSFRLQDSDMSFMEELNSLFDNKDLQDRHNCRAFSNLTATEGSYQFGDSPASHLVYTLSKQLLKDRSHFSLDVRTAESEGLIFLMRDKQETSHLALHISKGRFVFSLGSRGNKLKIRSRDKYNDGKWHTVMFSWDGLNGRLVIDGLKTRKGNSTKIFSLEKMSTISLGGAPSSKSQGIPKKSFAGCMKNVKINGAILGSPSQSTGVTPCYEGSFETGVFFAQEAGHIVIDKHFTSGLDFELVMDIRPQSLTSVLLYTGIVTGNQMSLYMDAGKLTLSVNTGDKENLASVTSLKSLCDGMWHTVTVTKKQNAVQLKVDNESQEAVGPTSVLNVTTAAPLFIGGIPAALETPWLPVKNSFAGCMRNIKVNRNLLSLSKVSEIHGAISLSRCPAA
ncbi:laminin subunit alpha-3 [Bombina bombina]|uniref:laminin subunit alpha-3 n=1 Tax=Bombina bombina TaxID=8345 RepID=UPI00235B1AC8|nr:laminin subunit alpha-3 [Bombina bombina]